MGRAVLPPCCLLGLRWSSPGVHRLDGRAKGYLQKDLGRHPPPGLLLANAPIPMQAAANPQLFKGPSDTPREVGPSLLWGHCSFPWILGCTRICLCPLRVCVSPILWKFCIKSCCPSKSDSLGIASPFARSPG